MTTTVDGPMSHRFEEIRAGDRVTIRESVSRREWARTITALTDAEPDTDSVTAKHWQVGFRDDGGQESLLYGYLGDPVTIHGKDSTRPPRDATVAAAVLTTLTEHPTVHDVMRVCSELDLEPIDVFRALIIQHRRI